MSKLGAAMMMMMLMMKLGSTELNMRQRGGVAIQVQLATLPYDYYLVTVKPVLSSPVLNGHPLLSGQL